MHLFFKHYREARGLSQAGLGCRVGVKQATISLIERGEFTPSDDLLAAIAAVLDVSPAFLLLQPITDEPVTEQAV